METNLYDDEDKTQRRRVIIVTVVIALLVLAIAAWAIMAIAGSDQNLKTSTNNTEVAVDDGTKNESTIAIEESGKEAPASEGVTSENSSNNTENKAEAPAETTNTENKTENNSSDNSKIEALKAEAASAEAEGKNAETPTEAPVVARTTREAVPETGPEELLPLALIIGTAVAFIGSRKLADRRV